VIGKLSVVLASLPSFALRAGCAIDNGPMPSTWTLKSPGDPVKFCTSRVTVLLSPGANTRGKLASATIGARTRVSRSLLP
jgi:hypothetical protein